MENWKQLLERALSEQYPGTRIEWTSDDDPTLIVPEDLFGQEPKIIEFATDLWRVWGGEVIFYPEQAVKRWVSR